MYEGYTNDLRLIKLKFEKKILSLATLDRELLRLTKVYNLPIWEVRTDYNLVRL